MDPAIYELLFRSGLKNARMSSASSSGPSMAAKWPPRGIWVQRAIRRLRSAHSQGGSNMSAGKSAMPVGTSMRPIGGHERLFS